MVKHMSKVVRKEDGAQGRVYVQATNVVVELVGLGAKVMSVSAFKREFVVVR